MNEYYLQEKSIFINTICGKYSNTLQAKKNPKLYAHINIYFRLLPWSLLKGVSIYSEQSYEHSPWSPYRQSVNKIQIDGNNLIMENYKLESAYRFAGSGFDEQILSTIKEQNLSRRENCEMIFYKSGKASYKGELKQDHKYIVERDGRKTYLVSKVEFDKNKFISIDEGIDIKTAEKVWGSENGYFEFQKVYETLK